LTYQALESSVGAADGLLSTVGTRADTAKRGLLIRKVNQDMLMNIHGCDGVASETDETSNASQINTQKGGGSLDSRGSLSIASGGAAKGSS